MALGAIGDGRLLLLLVGLLSASGERGRHGDGGGGWGYRGGRLGLWGGEGGGVRVGALGCH